MKIKHNTPDLLIADEIPWFIAIMLCFFILTFAGIGIGILSMGEWAGLIFLFVGGGLGLGAMSVFVERLQVILDAQADTLTLRSRTIMRHNETVVPLKDVIRAEAESRRSSASSSDTNSPRRTVSRAVFVVRDGSGTGGTTALPMTQVMSSGQGAGNLTRAVNEWLRALRGVGELTA